MINKYEQCFCEVDKCNGAFRTIISIIQLKHLKQLKQLLKQLKRLKQMESMELRFFLLRQPSSSSLCSFML